MCEMEESSPILSIILKNQEQIHNDDEEEASVSVIDKDAFTTTGASLCNDKANNMENVEIEAKKYSLSNY